MDESVEVAAKARDRSAGRQSASLVVVLLVAAWMLVPAVLAGGRTTIVPPAVTTDPATNVRTTSATLYGTLTDPGGADNATVWFRYRVPSNASGTAAGVGTGVLGENGTFSSELPGLANNTTYVYTADTETDAGTVTGEEE